MLHMPTALNILPKFNKSQITHITCVCKINSFLTLFFVWKCLGGSELTIKKQKEEMSEGIHSLTMKFPDSESVVCMLQYLHTRFFYFVMLRL